MISSMTGYGRGESSDETRVITLEIKTVNHRYNDIVIRMPKKFNQFEDKIKKAVKKRIKRGRVELYINLEENDDKNIIINPNINVARQYYESIVKINEELGLTDSVKLGNILRCPDVFDITTADEEEDTTWILLEDVLKKALDGLTEMRAKEGAALVEDINLRSGIISEIVEKIDEKSPLIAEEYKSKLKDRIKDLIEDTVEVDEARIALEVAIIADKGNITEELVRLKSHLVQLDNILKEKGSVGRKLDFLIQEMNRETNTIGSKSYNTEISNYVIDVKSEIEKIREQVQNIE